MKKSILMLFTMFFVMNMFGVQSVKAQDYKYIEIKLRLWSAGAKDEGSSVVLRTGERYFFNGQNSMTVKVPMNTEVMVEVISRGGGWLHATGQEPQFVMDVCASKYFYINDSWPSWKPICIFLYDEKILGDSWEW